MAAPAGVVLAEPDCAAACRVFGLVDEPGEVAADVGGPAWWASQLAGREL